MRSLDEDCPATGSSSERTESKVSLERPTSFPSFTTFGVGRDVVLALVDLGCNCMVWEKGRTGRTIISQV